MVVSDNMLIFYCLLALAFGTGMAVAFGLVIWLDRDREEEAKTKKAMKEGGPR